MNRREEVTGSRSHEEGERRRLRELDKRVSLLQDNFDTREEEMNWRENMRQTKITRFTHSRR